MARKKQEPSLDELVSAAASAPTGVERRRIAAKARSLGPELIKKPHGKGRPTKYSLAMAERVTKLVSEGRTLTRISSELNIALQDIYTWLELYPDFMESYHKARRLMCVSLIDNMLDQTESTEKEEALLLKVKSGIYQWVASRYNADQFSEKRTVQVNGAIDHKHTHDLSVEQRRRIAESWMMSQGDDVGLLIEGEVTEEPGVSTVNDESERLLPKRKKASLPKPKSDDGDNWRRD